MLGKPNATFWRLYRDGMKPYASWYRHCMRVPYKVKERHPNSVRIDRHLSVICKQRYQACYPTWYPEYPLNVTSTKDGGIKPVHELQDWKEEAYAYHFPGQVPKELTSPEDLMKYNSRFANMAKLVLRNARKSTQ